MTETDQPKGWLTPEEAIALAKLAKGKFVLELGAFKGRSTMVLADVATYVVSVDRHNGIPPFHSGDSLTEYLDVVRGRQNVAAVVAENWHDFSLFLKWGSFDLVYVDGDHDFESASRDAVLAQRLDPGMVAFHDLDDPPVAEAARSMFGDPDGLVGSLGWYER